MYVGLVSNIIPTVVGDVILISCDLMSVVTMTNLFCLKTTKKILKEVPTLNEG